MNITNSHPTQFDDLNEILISLTNDVSKILGNNLVGVYIVGSFALGDADEHSDCDFIVVIHNPLTEIQEKQIRELHDEIPTRPGHWSHDLEGSYALLSDLGSNKYIGRDWLFVDHGHREMEWSSHCNSEIDGFFMILVLLLWVPIQKQLLSLSILKLSAKECIMN